MNRAFLLFICITALVALAAAQGNGNGNGNNKPGPGGQPGPNGQSRKRALQIISTNRNVVIKVKAKKGEDEAHAWRARFLVSTGPQFSFMFFNKGKDTKSGAFFRTRFHSLVEYNDTTPPQGFDPQTSHIYSQVDLSSKVWTAFQETKTETVNGTLYAWTSQSQDGVMGIKVNIADSPMLPNGRKLPIRPEALKVDVWVNNYPWNQANGTYLALRSWTVASKTGRKENNVNTTGAAPDAPKESAVEFDTGASGIAARIGWTREVTIDGMNASVVSTSFDRDLSAAAQQFKDGSNPDSGDEENVSVTVSRMAWTFAKKGRWTRMDWDPDFGMDANSYDESESTTTTSDASFASTSIWTFCATLLVSLALFAM